MLAILAMMMTATYSFNVLQRHMGMQHMIIAREIEEMAASTALEAMEIVRARKFDPAVDALSPGEVLNESNLVFYNSTDHFTPGKACIPFANPGSICNYVGDFHKAVIESRPFELGDHTIHFDLEITVEYVDNTMSRSNQREIHKRITVRVQDVWPNGRRFLQQPIELSRVVSYTS